MRLLHGIWGQVLKIYSLYFQLPQILELYFFSQMFFHLGLLFLLLRLRPCLHFLLTHRIHLKPFKNSAEGSCFLSRDHKNCSLESFQSHKSRCHHCRCLSCRRAKVGMGYTKKCRCLRFCGERHDEILKSQAAGHQS